MMTATMIKLPAERGAQLRAFADREGLSVTEAIGALLRRAGAADAVPGFTVERLEGGFHCLSIDTFDVILHHTKVREIADAIDRLIHARAVGSDSVHDGNGKAVLLARGRGTAFLVVGRDALGERATRPLNLDLARDLAEQLRAALD